MKFAKKILFKNTKQARIFVEFLEIPSLGMLIESAAQSSSALSESSHIQNAYIVSMKNIKQLHLPTKMTLEVEVSIEQSLENIQLIYFEIFEDSKSIVSGHLTIAIEKEKIS